MRVTLLSLAALASCAAPPSLSPHPESRATAARPVPQQSTGWNFNVNALVGGRDMRDNTRWGNLEDHFVSGLEFDARPADLPIGMEFGVMSSFSYEEEEAGPIDFDTFGNVAEVYAGPRLTFESGPIRPYVGTGITALFAEIDLDGFGATFDDQDGSVGGYVHGGFYGQISHFNLGVDVRYVYGTDIELFSVEGDADYFQVAFMFGGNF